MSDKTTDNANDPLAGFQKIWMESMSKMSQAGFPLAADSPPPELLREIRNGVFRTLAQAWEEYMRSPQFLESMKQWMDQAISFRRMTNEFLGKARNEMQAPSLDDLNSAMLAIRHVEKRLLDRIEELSVQMKELSERLPAVPKNATAAKAAGLKARPRGQFKQPKIREAAAA
jgi:hypothetical protein